MKLIPALAVALLCAGCDQAAPVVDEFFLEVVIKKDVLGNYELDDDGLFSADCRLGQRIVSANDVSHPVLETISLSFRASEEASCFFEYQLPHGFCAFTSVQNGVNCKVSKGRGTESWMAELEFQNPQAGHLLCSFGCISYK